MNKLIARGSKLIALDINNLDHNLSPLATFFYKGSVLDTDLLEKIFRENKISTVFHLAAVLSTSGETNPNMAHEVNVNGTLNLLKICQKQSSPIKFIFPSSVAVYGMPNLKIKKQNAKVKEGEFLNPITMYGANKLYCENLGIYFSTYYMLLSTCYKGIDFRCVRFPGLISADTIPSGGTSDYAPEMLHAAAQNKTYKCFVRPNSIIPFMAMPDAVRALTELTEAPKNKLSQHIYNIRGFSASARQIEGVVKKYFPKSKISYEVDPKRQKIIDSWSEDVDDAKAQEDWGWKAKYDFRKAFENYLIPQIRKKYKY
jgi:threonine 3-dehydrogenase